MHFSATSLGHMWRCTVAALGAATMHAAHGATLSSLHLRGGSGAALSMEQMTKAMSDPDALDDLRAITDDPVAMAEVRAMMDDPAFREQMLAMVATGGAEQLDALKQAMAGDERLGGALSKMGPSLGAALDLLKRGTPDAEQFESAASALAACVRNLLQQPDEEKYRSLRSRSKALEARLTRHPGGMLCLEAIGFRAEPAVIHIYIHIYFYI